VFRGGGRVAIRNLMEVGLLSMFNVARAKRGSENGQGVLVENPSGHAPNSNKIRGVTTNFTVNTFDLLPKIGPARQNLFPTISYEYI
jgi:hypothetical protein